MFLSICTLICPAKWTLSILAKHISYRRNENIKFRKLSGRMDRLLYLGNRLMIILKVGMIVMFLKQYIPIELYSSEVNY